MNSEQYWWAHREKWLAKSRPKPDSFRFLWICFWSIWNNWIVCRYSLLWIWPWHSITRLYIYVQTFLLPKTICLTLYCDNLSKHSGFPIGFTVVYISSSLLIIPNEYFHCNYDIFGFWFRIDKVKMGNRLDLTNRHDFCLLPIAMFSSYITMCDAVNVYTIDYS